MSPKKAQQQSLLKQTLIKLMPSLKQAVFFSFFVNLLILAPTWYMFEVYDRVVNSQSHSTLLMLTMMVIFLYVLLQFIELVRTKVMFQAAIQFDQALNDYVFKSIFQAKLRQIPGGNAQAFSDLKTIQEGISSSALMAIIDMPFALLSLIIIFAINTKMGWFAVAGALVISIIAAINQYRIQPPLSEASRYSILSQNYANGVIRNAQVVESMGMLRSVHKRWIKSHNKFLSMQGVASDFGGTNSALSKLVQTMQGSLLLGLGCWLSIQGDLSMDGSMMLVGSILGGRVIAPIITFLANWRVIANSKVAFNRLDQFLKVSSESNQTMKLPPPVGHLSAEGVVAAPPNSQTPILKGVTFKLPAGNSLAIVGPSASGKTTLARLITGIWPALSGKVRLDGADIYQWKKSELGPYVGYLPQDVELFDGSLAENIARFGDIDMEKVRTAANIVGLDGLISDLKDGYETQVGDEGSFLSGGQRQRVALARAIYGMPKFVVLDEPNSSLDEAGDVALLNALNYIKSQDTTLVVITHRMQVLSAIDYVMVLTEGQIKSFGPRDEVLNSLNQKNQPIATVTQDSNGAE
jgi:ATP-binding cassette, subfamily C, bacterial exporter for protease/lipase